MGCREQLDTLAGEIIHLDGWISTRHVDDGQRQVARARVLSTSLRDGSAKPLIELSNQWPYSLMALRPWGSCSDP